MFNKVIAMGEKGEMGRLHIGHGEDAGRSVSRRGRLFKPPDLWCLLGRS